MKVQYNLYNIDESGPYEVDVDVDSNPTVTESDGEYIAKRCMNDFLAKNDGLPKEFEIVFQYGGISWRYLFSLAMFPRVSIVRLANGIYR